MSEQFLDTKIKDTEKRKDRFKKLATKRTVRIIKLLNLLENCANRTNYYYTEDQVDKIFTTLQDKLEAVKKRFGNATKDKDMIDFEL